MPCQENGFPACEARDEQVDGKGCDHNDPDLSAVHCADVNGF